MATLTMAEALQQAVRYHQAGQLAQAEQLYRAVLQADPQQVDALHLLGLIAYQVGQPEAAATCIGQALRLKPDFAQAHNSLGVVLQSQGRLEEAAASLRQALHLQPGYAEAHNNLGKVLHAQGQLAEAQASWQQALRLQPGYVEAYNQVLALAVRQHQAGRLPQAEQLYRAALEANPHQVDVLHLLGVIAYQEGRLQEAAGSLREALRLKPDFATAHNNLGVVLQCQGQLDEAQASLREALRLQPDYAEAHMNLGNVLKNQWQLEAAVASLRQALRLQPDYAEAHLNLGNALQEQGQSEAAAASVRQALRCKPDFAEAHLNLGKIYQAQGKLDEAAASLHQALRCKPDYASAYNRLGGVLTIQGKLEEAVAACQQALHLEPDYAMAHSNLLFILQYRPGVTPQELAAAHAEYERRHAARFRASWRPHANVPDPDRRLRLGFLSPDLGCHPVGYFLIRPLEQFDPQQAEVVCYSDRHNPDELTARIRAAAALWRDVAGWDDDRLAQQIRTDRIDILFDLAGHTARNRLLVFARKPAPLQVTWAGYDGTTGLQAMDYLLADRHEVPPGDEVHYRERVLRLPDGYVCYDPPAYAPPVAPLPALQTGRVTLGSFNNPAKLTADVVAVWSRVLARLPQARLVLKYTGLDDPAVAGRLAGLFAGQGVDPARVQFRGRSPHAELLAHYHDIDLALDPFPYSGCLTTCEALWMGVPVVTFPGATFVSRHSLSHLATVGLMEAVAGDLEKYVEVAVALAEDLPRLAGLRARLRAQMAGSPLCDGRRFAANLLALLRDAWRQWAAQAVREGGPDGEGLPPRLE
jgi:predicted O-linked N-acetylglucosamine transferase (SPINDLY family)